MSDTPRPYGVEYWLQRQHGPPLPGKVRGMSGERLIVLHKAECAYMRREMLRPHIGASLDDSDPVAHKAEVDRILGELSDEDVSVALRGIAKNMADDRDCCPECGREYDE